MIGLNAYFFMIVLIQDPVLALGTLSAALRGNALDLQRLLTASATASASNLGTAVPIFISSAQQVGLAL